MSAFNSAIDEKQIVFYTFFEIFGNLNSVFIDRSKLNTRLNRGRVKQCIGIFFKQNPILTE